MFLVYFAALCNRVAALEEQYSSLEDRGKRWKRAPHIVSFIYSPTLLVRNISQSRPHNPWFSLQSQRAAKNCTTNGKRYGQFQTVYACS